MKYLSALIVSAFVFAGAQAGDVEVAGMKSAAPKGWKEEPPANNMRLTQFKLPKAEGDAEDAELARRLPIRRWALSVIAYFHVQFIVDNDDLHVNPAGLRVPQGIGQ